VIYSERRKVLEGDDEWLKSHIKEITEEVLNSGLDFYLNEHASLEEGWDFDGLSKWAQRKFAITIEKTFFEAKARDIIRDELLAEIMRAYDEKEAQLGAEHMRHIERFVMLQVTDSRWKDHLYAMDNLRDGIGLRAYGQKDPLVEYQHEGYDMFVQMTDSIKEEVVEFVFRVQAVRPEAQKSVFNAVPQKLEHAEAADILKITRQQQPESRQDVPPEELAQYKRETPKVGRNDPCPCGKINPKTGKIMKYKLCCYPKYG